MAQQQDPGGKTVTNHPDARKPKGGSNNVIIGTVLAVLVVVFSFFFFGSWGENDPGASEPAAVASDDGMATTGDGATAAE